MLDGRITLLRSHTTFEATNLACQMIALGLAHVESSTLQAEGDEVQE